MNEFQITTTRNAQDDLPQEGDRIVIDGIPATVLRVDVFHGIHYEVEIPGLPAVSIRDWAPWEIILDLKKVGPTQ